MALPVYFRRARYGLTLIEMLVVLAVFSILAILFFLSSSHAIVKTRLSRAVHEEKLLSRALQNYEADFLDVPTQAQGLDKLMGPIAYLTHVPMDPFTEGKQPREYVYLYGISPAHKWLIVSVGPDGTSELAQAIEEIRQRNPVKLSDANGYSVPALMTPKEAQELIDRYTYDPTNGTVSKGDIITPYGQ